MPFQGTEGKEFALKSSLSLATCRDTLKLSQTAGKSGPKVGVGTVCLRQQGQVGKVIGVFPDAINLLPNHCQGELSSGDLEPLSARFLSTSMV